MTFEESWKNIASFLTSIDDNWSIFYEKQCIGTFDSISNTQTMDNILASNDVEKVTFSCRGESMYYTYPEVVQRMDAMRCREFQCILLAGGQGQGLYPLSEFIPKPMLPVANKPLIAYPVKYLVHNGVKDIIIVYSRSQKGMDDCIHQLQIEYREKCIIRRRVLDDDDTMDSASAVRAVSDWIHSDFIVVPCDIITTINLQDIANVHRAMINSSATLVLLNPPQTQTTESDKKKSHLSVEHYIALTDIDDILTRGGDIIENNSQPNQPKITPMRVPFYSTSISEELNLGRSFYKKWSNATFSDRYNDVHIYIFAKWIIDLLKNNTKIHSLKHELIPFIVSMQFSDQLEKDSYLGGKCIYPEGLLASSYNIDSSDMVRVYACIVDGKVFCKRTNTIDAYMEMNRDIAKGEVRLYLPTDKFGAEDKKEIKKEVVKGEKKEKGDKKQARESRQEKGKRALIQIGVECCVSPTVSLGEGNTVAMKRTCIGAGCKIGNDVKIVNSVIMNDVVIGDYVTIQNSIISSKATIESHVKMDNCKIASGYTVPSGDYRDETLKKEKEFVI